MRTAHLALAFGVLLPPSAARGQAPSWPPPDTARATREAQFARALEQIKGKEKLPAESVYREIQSLNGIPAGRLLAIMNTGYSRSLGVNCSFCHVEDAWEREDSTRKQTARDMSAMVKAINDTVLPRIEGLKSKKDRPVVNCTTCHRGQPKPAISLDSR